MEDLTHECGIAAVYQLPGSPLSSLIPGTNRRDTVRLLPGMLLDMQNRGQLAAGMTTWNPERLQLIDTHKDVGGVGEAFRVNHPADFERLMTEYAGPAGIGHVRYATCGRDDRSYAQPFERHHIARSKWFSFAFNGQLANYDGLREEILRSTDFHLTRETDTEIINHLISQWLSENPGRTHVEMLNDLSARLDGSWNIVYLDAVGRMFVSRDPRGIRPVCYAVRDGLFAAASESAALVHLGFAQSEITDLEPGCMLTIGPDEGLKVHRYAKSPGTAHCFFEWIYFANAGSRMDGQGVYLTRKRLGEKLAEAEHVPRDSNTIVVPVPDTAKAAADAMAFALGVPSLEGLLRNRYVGRTFIESRGRAEKVRMKYTPLKEVLQGKRIILVDDSIVRATTLRELIQLLRDHGEAAEIHVRIACPPIIAPCFYGINMSTMQELYAPAFVDGTSITETEEAEIAKDINADSLRYLRVEALEECIGIQRDRLCTACVDTVYPTDAGRSSYENACRDAGVNPHPCAGDCRRKQPE